MFSKTAYSIVSISNSFVVATPALTIRPFGFLSSRRLLGALVAEHPSNPSGLPPSSIFAFDIFGFMIESKTKMLPQFHLAPLAMRRQGQHKGASFFLRKNYDTISKYV